MSTPVLDRVSTSADQDSRGSWRAVCPLDELEPFWGEAALLHGVQIALVRVPENRVYAVDHWDPRAQANVMARGIIGSSKGKTTVASPIYKQVYDLKTGECLSEPGPALTAYPTRVINGQVQVFL
ncbi:nitrite reductase small subunit NirD [Nesterenkonia haasae]|uniref:nitrite reductase small subunit NirD n=1 Tax=Nesterenkonia haasae TaxID=2587813 RepID=UPI001392017D|nr:nitrite reductase small subunit NirD [Nesterenkonia haasae]NDK32929.1 nitrite reductase small subunit NirD [Nesterenkonia haasae]